LNYLQKSSNHDQLQLSLCAYHEDLTDVGFLLFMPFNLLLQNALECNSIGGKLGDTFS